MALKPRPSAQPTTVGHISHDALARVEERVQDILARREAELRQARRAAERLKRP
jgi:hypothetical protein